MPNHARMWERKLYHEIGGHNKNMPVADDLEIINPNFFENTDDSCEKSIILINITIGTVPLIITQTI